MQLRGAALMVALFSGAAGQAEDLRVTLGATAYGYSVQVQVNGVAIPEIEGGKSEVVQLYAPNHPQKARTHPRFHHLFCLRSGRNTIRIHYEEEDWTKSMLPLSFEMRSLAYTTAVFDFRPKRTKSGTIDTHFEIHEVMPQGYRTQELAAKP